mmetsp:Transcript_26798/g.67213  ORF Transcript_26798/g.67213 Transcript_26798/m.67213 type:complete len:351 (-) Transcript_26798:502-1554(-)
MSKWCTQVPESSRYEVNALWKGYDYLAEVQREVPAPPGLPSALPQLPSPSRIIVPFDTSQIARPLSWTAESLPSVDSSPVYSPRDSVPASSDSGVFMDGCLNLTHAGGKPRSPSAAREGPGPASSPRNTQSERFQLDDAAGTPSKRDRECARSLEHRAYLREQKLAEEARESERVRARNTVVELDEFGQRVVPLKRSRSTTSEELPKKKQETPKQSVGNESKATEDSFKNTSRKRVERSPATSPKAGIKASETPPNDRKALNGVHDEAIVDVDASGMPQLSSQPPLDSGIIEVGSLTLAQQLQMMDALSSAIQMRGEQIFEKRELREHFDRAFERLKSTQDASAAIRRPN